MGLRACRDIRKRRNTHARHTRALTRYRRVREMLLGIEEYSEGELSWPWLSDLRGRPADRKAANKFVLGAIMDYQMKGDQVWNNARVLSEDILGDPDDLWAMISSRSERAMEYLFRNPLHPGRARHPPRTAQKGAKGRSLHRFPGRTSRRVRKIAAHIAERYGGDARGMWQNLPTDTILRNLHDIGTGPQTSRMIVGALIDTGQIKGKGDLKADLHVRRVLGRIFTGGEVSAGEALAIADGMEPGNSWLLNKYIYRLGRSVCRKRPQCHRCHLRDECSYGSGSARNQECG